MNTEAIVNSVDSLMDTIINEEVSYAKANKDNPELRKFLNELNKDNNIKFTADDILGMAKLNLN